MGIVNVWNSISNEIVRRSNTKRFVKTGLNLIINNFFLSCMHVDLWCIMCSCLSRMQNIKFDMILELYTA